MNKYQITVTKEQLDALSRIVDESPDEGEDQMTLAAMLTKLKTWTDEGGEGPFDLTEVD